MKKQELNTNEEEYTFNELLNEVDKNKKEELEIRAEARNGRDIYVLRRAFNGHNRTEGYYSVENPNLEILRNKRFSVSIRPGEFETFRKNFLKPLIDKYGGDTPLVSISEEIKAQMDSYITLRNLARNVLKQKTVNNTYENNKRKTLDNNLQKKATGEYTNFEMSSKNLEKMQEMFDQSRDEEKIKDCLMIDNKKYNKYKTFSMPGNDESNLRALKEVEDLLAKGADATVRTYGSNSHREFVIYQYGLPNTIEKASNNIKKFRKRLLDKLYSTLD